MDGLPGAPPRRSEWIDVSRPLTPATPVWPGDRAFQLDRVMTGEITTSSFATSCHVGTHVDAPGHVDATAGGVESIPLGRLIGPAEVVAVSAEVVAPEHLPAGWSPAAPRLLLRTDSHPLEAPIGPGLAALDARLVHWLADRNVVLVGIDTPSVDPAGDLELSAHRALGRRGMVGLEGLDLSRVAPGLYTLIALPLPLEGAEASPVRAVLLAPGR